MKRLARLVVAAVCSLRRYLYGLKWVLGKRGDVQMDSRANRLIVKIMVQNEEKIISTTILVNP